LGGFSQVKADLESNNIKAIFISSDPLDKATEMAAEIGLPVGYGVDQAMIESVGGYWEADRKFGQPAEFLLSPENTIVQLSYSDGPIGRTDAADVVKLVGFRQKARESK
jgi:hypothetical protein